MTQPPITEWLDSQECRNARPAAWFRRHSGLLISVNRAGRGYSHAYGRLPQPIPQADLWSEGAREVLLPTLVTTERYIGAIGHGGLVWIGDGWSGAHLALTEAEHRETPAYRCWLEARTGVPAPRPPAPIVHRPDPIPNNPTAPPAKPGRAVQLALF